VATFELHTKDFMGRIAQALRHMSNTIELSESIGESLVSSTVQRFENEEDPEGKSWKPSKRAIEENGQTLTDTGRLKGSIGYEATPVLVAVGTNVEYAEIHQMGGVKKGRRYPKRAFVGINDEDKQEAKHMMLKFMEDAFK
jgi:phage virion morphogenesis protein